MRHASCVMRHASCVMRCGMQAVSGGKPPKKSLNVMFPYPKEASARNVQICNYSGKRYYYKAPCPNAIHPILHPIYTLSTP